MTMQRCILDQWLMAKLKTKANFLETLEKEQWQRILSSLKHAKRHSSFYAKALQSFNLEEFTKNDFYKLPFTTAMHLQKPEQLLCVSQSEVVRMVTLQTSGTTALPKRLAFSHEDLESTMDFFATGMSQLIKPRQRLLVLWPGAMRPNGVSALLKQALAKQNIEVFAGEACTTKQSLSEEIIKYNPHTIVASPKQLSILANILQQQNLANLALQSILASAEHLDPSLEHHLQQHGLLVLDHYGITEAGYGGGVQCLAKNGYHLRELDIFVEIIHPKTLQPMEYRQEGEIVITTLNRKAMPLIRYRTGDVASILQGPCTCGSPLRRLSKIKGRLIYNSSAQHYSIEHCVKGIFYERSTKLTL